MNKLKKISDSHYEGSLCENVEAKVNKIGEDTWHVFIRDNNPNIKFPIVGTVTHTKEHAFEFLKNYEGCY